MQPQTRPYDEMLLRASLMLNKYQFQYQEINVPFETGMRTRLKIAEILGLEFDLGQLITAVLYMSVSKKQHRLIHHASDHMCYFRRSAVTPSPTRHYTKEQRFVQGNEQEKCADFSLSSRSSQYLLLRKLLR